MMIDRSFFQRDPVTCARELVGCELRWKQCAGIVVETEAYAAVNDEACHTFARPSAREFIARHRAGTAYVYLNYGMYWLLNVLVKGRAEDGFVLIRALEPTLGLDVMTQRRLAHRKTRIVQPHALCSGPGKLSLALGVDGRDHGRDLFSSKTIGFRQRERVTEIIEDTRIGISRAAHFPWRFLARGNACVSRMPASAAAGFRGGRRIQP